MTTDRIGQILRLTCNMTADSYARIDNQLSRAASWGPCGAVVEVTVGGSVNLSRLDRIVNRIMSALPGRPLAVVARNKIALKQISDAGFGFVVPVFGSVEQALRHPTLRPHVLAGAEVLLLAAGKGTRAWPLTDTLPKPMLPVLGQPILQHLIMHCRSFGVRDFCMNISHLASHIEGHFGAGRDVGARITYSHEGTMTATGFTPRPLGSASTLAQMHRQHGSFDRPFIVMCGDALTDIDLGAMMQAHANSGAIATVATRSVTAAQQGRYGIFETTRDGRARRFLEKPGTGETDSLMASAGIYIFDPSVLNFVHPSDHQDIGADLLPALIAAGLPVTCHNAPFGWTDIGTFGDYHRAELAAVSDVIQGLHRGPGIWSAQAFVSDGAHLSPNARIDGAVFLAPGARVEDGAWLKGPVSIGTGCTISARSVVQESVVLAGTHVAPGSVVSGMVAGPDWALRPDLHVPNGRPLPSLEGLGHVNDTRRDILASVA